MPGISRRLRPLSARLGVAVIVAGGAAACLTGSGRPIGEIDARYATVHNALTAIGLSEVGALHDVRVGPGQDAVVELELPSGCTTIVAVGGTSVNDLEASLKDSGGARVARATTHTSEATIRACVETAGRYTLALTANRGGGALLVSTWAGAAPAPPFASSGHGGDGGLARGTCDAPLPLSAGDFAGSTAHGLEENESKKCPNTSAAEIVYRLDVTTRQKVALAVETARFDGVLYVRKADCADKEAEVACNDDAAPPGGGAVDQRHSRVELVLDPGAYYVFVDGFSGAGGTYKLHVDLTDVPPLATLCGQAPLLDEGTPVSGTTEGAYDEVSATCGDGAHGPDAVYAYSLAKRARVRVVETSDDFGPVVHVRAQCDDADTTVGCADSGGAEHEAAFVGVLDVGRYAVFADSNAADASGNYSLSVETAPELGAASVHGDRCADAIPLTKADLVVHGDTFTAHDDVAGKCGGTGAPDVFYRVDVGARTRFKAAITHEQASHNLILLRGCGAKSELACGKTVDRMLAPGAYFLAVDGMSPESFGTFTFEWSTRDTLAQEAACQAPPRLREGETLSGTTAGGATDKFSPSCSATDGSGGAADVVYQLLLPARRRVHLALRPSGWNGVLSVRKPCLEQQGPGNGGELACTAGAEGNLEYDQTLDAGTYYVVVDGQRPSDVGSFTLEYKR